jgi:hypothetical protein
VRIRAYLPYGRGGPRREGRLKETENPQKYQKTGDGARRPYERPSVTWEEDFTPYAFSACGKMMGQGGACVGNRRS